MPKYRVPDSGFDPIKYVTLNGRDATALNLPKLVRRDGSAQVGAVLCYDDSGQRVTLFGWRPFVDLLATRPTGQLLMPDGLLSHMALGWPEDWVTKDGIKPPTVSRIYTKPRVAKPAPSPSPWEQELLDALDESIEATG